MERAKSNAKIAMADIIISRMNQSVEISSFSGKKEISQAQNIAKYSDIWRREVGER